MTNPITATGFLARTAARNPEARTLQAGSGIAITNPAGVAGDPVISTSGSSISADIASASTTDLSTATGGYVNITGSVTITSFGTVAAGVLMTLKFTGAPLLTYNATSLIIPGAANLQIVAGSVARMRSLGSGNWFLEEFSWGTGLGVTAAWPITLGGHGQTTANAGKDALSTKGADIASASTTNIAGSNGDVVDVTGSVTITALGTSAAGIQRVVRFTGAPLLTYNATSLILPGAANIQAAANDVARFVSLGSGNWYCANYSRATGTGTMAAQNANAIAVTGGDIVDTAHRRKDNVQTASYTCVLADQYQVIAGNHATVAIVITVPQYSSVNWPEGTELVAVQRGAAAVSFAAGSGVTINKPSDRTLVARAQYAFCGIRHTSTQNTWEEIGGFGT